MEHDLQAFHPAVEPSQDREAEVQPKPPISCAKGLYFLTVLHFLVGWELGRAGQKISMGGKMASL